MYQYQTIKIISFLVLLCMFNNAWANLFIAPQRIVFEDRQRSASVNLVNTSNTSNTYRLSWVQQKQTEIGGRYENLPSNSTDVPNASSMLRFSPRQITLEPGEKQTIRIALRRTKNLTRGEHRSHLLFQALPNEGTGNDQSGGAKIKVNLLMGFSIPVIVRQGKLNASAKITDVKIIKTTDYDKTFYGVRITLKRSGSHATYGTLKIFWKNLKFGKYKQIALLNNVVLYPESAVVRYQAGLKNFTPTSGYLKIIYEGRKEFEGKNFSTTEIKITSNNIIFEQRN